MTVAAVAGVNAPPVYSRPGLGCAMCGDCCERIKISLGRPGFTAAVSTSGGLGVGKRAIGDWGRLQQSAGDYARDAAFILRWMEPTGEVTDARRWTDEDGVERYVTSRQIWRCLKFDPERRVCTAHAERPRMCSEYPFYGREPGGSNTPNDDELRCSYWLDVDPDERPAGARPLIPLTVL